jgi:hypothetical protein
LDELFVQALNSGDLDALYEPRSADWPPSDESKDDFRSKKSQPDQRLGMPHLGEIMTAIDPELIERVKAAKARQQASPLRYSDRSRIAFVVHSFNRPANIDQLVSGLRHIDDHELIVCDDGSLDDSREK